MATPGNASAHVETGHAINTANSRYRIWVIAENKIFFIINTLSEPEQSHNNKENKMVREVEHSIAAFLGTLPEQVRIWDAKLVSAMVQHPGHFEAFKAGNELDKWRIYMTLRTRALQAR